MTLVALAGLVRARSGGLVCALDCARAHFHVRNMCAVRFVCVICECDYDPNRRFILMQWNVVFCMSFVVGVVQCAFDACLYGLQVF